jgi:hypothetical protein
MWALAYGFQFAVAWWLVIDAGVVMGIAGPEYLIGVGSTIGFLMCDWAYNYERRLDFLSGVLKLL